METQKKTVITIGATVNAPVEKIWEYWSKPEHIMKWNAASDDWHTPRAENDLRTGGTFSSRMEAKDGSWGFDFGGVYDNVVTHERISYTMGDGRKVDVIFTPQGNSTKIEESFEAEETNPVEMQRTGWQSILDNFKKYTEAN
ncbi:MAG TPA: SRPBCC family protein [Chitinophaga sp.]|uniref:SRPBCC family protein n=1 Tax=Chitinophaga sp. TaxID=1869181 RepID=UPI002DBE413A|nr:SRPBCC family protein [Chitinophaga sp.]HEU4555431.1 SRPBCC family protein [Chitinophaga sp.]